MPEQPEKRWYVTTTIPYVNARPHIGFALEIVLTDALARYHRLVGEDVRFLTGTDENALKNVQTAESEGIPVAELVARNAERFYALRGPLNLSFDDFVRTSADPRHAPGVQKLWEACARSGDIYKRAYRGLYCVSCEQFYTEDELVDGLCPIHHTKPEVVEEENYFFRLSRYGERLEALITSGTLRIVPETRRNEVLSFIRRGLEDFSISRSHARAHGWGVPVPGDPDQVMYVWFDALGNYISALDYADEGPLYERYWLTNPHRVHMLGKDVIRFHAVYWPAMLLSAGAPPPTEAFVHGFITVSGQKISKTLGNVVDPVALAEEYGTDALRYFLLAAIDASVDSDFTLERFVRVFNNDLADQLGNLLHRTVNMLQRYFDGVVPAPGPSGESELALQHIAKELPVEVDAAIRRFAPHEALAAIWQLIGAANKYVASEEPWTLAKRRNSGGDDAEAVGLRLATVLYTLTETLRLAAHYCVPFIPATAEAIAARLGIELDASDWSQAVRWGRYPHGTHVQAGAVLFPKHEIAEETA
jgi:methionyl-tRNA synthetase